jgi:hypothetical protein
MGTRRTALCFVVVLCSTCTTTSTSPSLVVHQTSGQPKGHAPIRPAIFERTCGSDVYGNLGRNWREAATVVGPLALVYLSIYADATARTFGARGDRYLSLKLLAVVDPGGDVTVTVPISLRQRLGLLYDPSAFKMTGRYRVVEGEPAVRFRPCDIHRATQFNGGLIAAGPGCYALSVRVEGGPSRSFRFPLGAPC